MRPLGRLRPGPDPVELHVLARVARLVGRPDRLHRLDPLPHDGHPPPRVGAVVGHLLPVPAGADAELEPPAGQVVDAGHLLGRGDRVPLDDQADAGADPQPRGGGHRGGHRDEQVEGVRVPARQLTAARVRRRPAGRDVRVLGEEQRLVPALLGEPRQVRGRDGIVGREDRYAGVHAPKPRYRTGRVSRYSPNRASTSGSDRTTAAPGAGICPSRPCPLRPARTICTARMPAAMLPAQ